jgi:hypothetical protein
MRPARGRYKKARAAHLLSQGFEDSGTWLTDVRGTGLKYEILYPEKGI